MKKLLFLICITCGALLFSTRVIAQENQSSRLYHIETKDGNSFIGYIISRDSVTITLNALNMGKITIPVLNIKLIKEVRPGELVNGKLLYQNPQATRYFFMPNGYGLKPGEGYYQNILIFFNQMAVGITDNFSVGGGLVPLFLYGGSPTPVWITPKFSIPVTKNKFNIGVGALAGTILGVNKSGFGILYGIATFGSRDTNLSLGLGYGYTADALSKTPAFNISGRVRIGAKSYLISENYFLTIGEQSTTFFSFGGRWMIGKTSLDGFLIMPSYSGLRKLIAIPMLGIAIPFGGRR